MARRLLISLILFITLFLTACAPSGQGEVEPPAVLSTATTSPQPGVPVPVGNVIYKPLSQTTEIVPNCGGGTEPVVKHPSLTSVSANSVEWEVGGQFGVGLRVQPPGSPVGVDLAGVIEVADRTKLEQNLQQGISWDLPAAPGEIMTYVLSWDELWQAAYVDVTFAEQDVRRVNVTYRTGVQSNIANSYRQACDGSQGTGSVASATTSLAAPPSGGGSVEPQDSSGELSTPPPADSSEAQTTFRERFTASIGTGPLSAASFSDGLAEYTADYLAANKGRLQTMNIVSTPTGCATAFYESERIWFGSTRPTKIMINGQLVAEYTQPGDFRGNHGSIFDWKVNIGDEICVEMTPEIQFHLNFGPDVDVHYDSYCFRGNC